MQSHYAKLLRATLTAAYLSLSSLQTALVLGGIMLGASSARADSEMQKFYASLPWPPGTRERVGRPAADNPGQPGSWIFSRVATCASIKQIEMQRENKNVSLKEIEDGISKDCEDERNLQENPRDWHYLDTHNFLTSAGMQTEERLAAIRRYKLLAKAERRLRFEGKAIPGYRPSKEAVEILTWQRKVTATNLAYMSCVDDALRNLVPFSTDPSNVVADAAIGLCSLRRSESVAAARERARAYDGLEFDRQLRSEALGKIATIRVEMQRINSTPPAVATSPPSQTGAPMKANGGIFVVPVEINGAMTLDFAIDSGAADVSVPSDVFSTLKRTGTIKNSDIIGEQTYVLADGSKTQSVTFTIRSLKVDGKIVENVKGSVASSQATLLLGQSFLGRFKSWSINNTTHELVLEPQ